MGRPDRRSAGRSSRVPYVRGEHPEDRHARRLASNLAAEEEARKRLAALGVALEVKNGGQHWIFTSQGRAGSVAEWWPSSAKLVFAHQWDQGFHAHDIDQVIREVRRRWKIAPSKEG